MESKPAKVASVDEYIAQCSPEIQPVLNQLRAVIRAAAPQAVEKISYGMPGFYQNATLVWFGAHARHIGFYPTGEGVEAFKAELGSYKMSKGAIQLPLDQPLPVDLITRIVKYRLESTQKKKA
jgi:uncharacterized protein YdhG (YjbR/CyaY superfamily)